MDQKELRESTVLTLVFPAEIEMQVISMRRWGEKADSVGRGVQFGMCRCAEPSVLARPSSLSSSSEAGLPVGAALKPSALYVATSSWDWVPNSFKSAPQFYTTLTVF